MAPSASRHLLLNKITAPHLLAVWCVRNVHFHLTHTHSHTHFRSWLIPPAPTLTTGCSCVPGIMAFASCICWASIAIFFCWMRLFLPLISSWVFRWGGGWRYLQFSLEQRPCWDGRRERDETGSVLAMKSHRETNRGRWIRTILPWTVS